MSRHFEGGRTLSAIVFAARLILVALFLTAGIGKLRDLSSARRAVTEFGVPTRWVRPLAITLPCLEVAIALSLLPVESAPIAAAAAAGLLTVFVAAMVFNLARGRRPDCHCLGQIYSEPIGPSVIARNLVLMGAALLVAVASWHSGGPGIVEPIERLSGTAQLAIEVAAVAIAILAMQGWIIHRLQRGREETLEHLQWLESLVTAGDTFTPMQFPASGAKVLDGDEGPDDALWSDGAPSREAAE